MPGAQTQAPRAATTMRFRPTRVVFVLIPCFLENRVCVCFGSDCWKSGVGGASWLEEPNLGAGVSGRGSHQRGAMAERAAGFAGAGSRGVWAGWASGGLWSKMPACISARVEKARLLQG